MVLTYKPRMYVSADKNFLESVLYNASLVIYNFNTLSNKELYLSTNKLFDIILSKNEIEYLSNNSISIADYVSSFIKEDIGYISYITDVKEILNTLSKNFENKTVKSNIKRLTNDIKYN